MVSPRRRGSKTVLLLLVLAGYGAAVAEAGGRGDTQIAAPTRESEPCTTLSATQYSRLLDDHFLKRRVPTFEEYEDYRARIEVIEYNALLSTSNPVFTMPRNVTEQDDVYLRLRGNTYAYNYNASWTASDLTQGLLLNVIGASPTQGVFALQTARTADCSGDASRRGYCRSRCHQHRRGGGGGRCKGATRWGHRVQTLKGSAGECQWPRRSRGEHGRPHR